MEGIALILIGTAIFSHSWHLLGLYADARTVGVIMASLALALLVSMFTFQPQFLGSVSSGAIVRAGETTVLSALIVTWAVYAAAVAANCLWDMEDRAIGFYSVLLAVASLVMLFFFLQIWALDNDAVAVLLLAIASALLAIVSGLLFFTLAFQFPVMRLVSGWALLIQSIVVVGFGMTMITTTITA